MTLPHLMRSARHRCWQRHGISRLPDIEGTQPQKKTFKPSPIGSFHLEMAEVRKAATVKKYHYETPQHLKEHLQAFLMAYNFAKRLKTHRGLTP